MKRYYCPSPDAMDCPYLSQLGRCTLVNEGYDPLKECDDAYCYDPDGENWEDDEE